MAKQLKNVEDLRAARATKYPWHEWTNGKVWEAIQGEDFTLPMNNFRAVLHQRARNWRTKVTVTTAGLPEGHVRFQFYDEN